MDVIKTKESDLSKLKGKKYNRDRKCWCLFIYIDILIMFCCKYGYGNCPEFLLSNDCRLWLCSTDHLTSDLKLWVVMVWKCQIKSLKPSRILVIIWNELLLSLGSRNGTMSLGTAIHFASSLWSWLWIPSFPSYVSRFVTHHDIPEVLFGCKPNSLTCISSLIPVLWVYWSGKDLKSVSLQTFLSEADMLWYNWKPAQNSFTSRKQHWPKTTGWSKVLQHTVKSCGLADVWLWPTCVVILFFSNTW